MVTLSFAKEKLMQSLQSREEKGHNLGYDGVNQIRSARMVWLALFVAILLCGCSVGPNFVKPEAVVSPNWLDADDWRVKTGPAEYRNWWKAFNDPVLDRLIDQAYRGNLSLRVAGVRVMEARAQLGIAVGRLYPQAQQASGSLQDVGTSERSAIGALLGSSPAPRVNNLFDYWQDQIGVSASWEIDFWGKFRRAIESADANLLATVADYDSALVSLTADVTNSYIAIRTLEKRLSIARQNVETQKESLKVTEDRFQYGMASRLDVEQAKTLLNDTWASVPVLETQLRQAKNSLSLLLGMLPSDLSEVLEGSSEIPVSPPEIVVGIPNDLLRRRPDVRSAEYQAAAQSAQIGVAKADLYPAFSLTGMFGFLSTNVNDFKLSNMFDWNSRTFQFGPSVQWNMFNYGRITNNVRMQDARFQQLLIAYQNTVLKAHKEVEDALVAFLKAQERVEFLTRSAAAAKTAFDLAVEQYREGLKDFTTVLIAQQALLNEQDNLTVTLGNLSSNLVGVYRGLGGGWEIRQGKELVPPEVKEEMAKRTNWGALLAPASFEQLTSEERKSEIRLPEW
ncbi:MAG: efflux transporter outer membrane subunit [Syntrophorhabdales bacterium]|jgi:NodT family efflux transporter outer membrane factor (OMF) lipoprotein